MVGEKGYKFTSALIREKFLMCTRTQILDIFFKSHDAGRKVFFSPTVRIKKCTVQRN